LKKPNGALKNIHPEVSNDKFVYSNFEQQCLKFSWEVQIITQFGQKENQKSLVFSLNYSRIVTKAQDILTSHPTTS
jgi:hypothetical protein